MMEKGIRFKKDNVEGGIVLCLLELKLIFGNTSPITFHTRYIDLSLNYVQNAEVIFYGLVMAYQPF